MNACKSPAFLLFLPLKCAHKRMALKTWQRTPCIWLLTSWAVTREAEPFVCLNNYPPVFRAHVHCWILVDNYSCHWLFFECDMLVSGR